MEEEFSCKGHGSTEILVRKKPPQQNFQQQLSGDLINTQVGLVQHAAWDKGG